MKYISTRGGIQPIGFQDAVMMGLATDGGLLLPASIPNVADKMEEWRHLSYRQLAYQVMRPFIGTEIPAADLRDLIDRSYDAFEHPDVAPLIDLGDVHLLELFHGPTLAFKDIALQFLGNLFEYILARSGGRLNILGATSGDTGSAAIHGVRGKQNISIFILHPYKRISPQQERQMTTVLDDNVFNVAIVGSFDDGQRIVKGLFGDLPFKDRYHLGAVNSVNWARVLAQVVYYFWGAFRLQERTGAASIRVSVPTGNFGDIFAGYVAAQMGAPISKLLLATNENDILARFFQGGVYERGDVRKTLSPSMDIQVASNFERYLYYHLDGDSERLRFLMSCFTESGSMKVHRPGKHGVDPLIGTGVGTTADTIETIRRYYRSHEYVLDPHSAVGVHVARENLHPDEPTMCLATAHPAKFSQAVIEALGRNVATHPTLEALTGKGTRCAILQADEAEVKRFMVEKLIELDAREAAS